MKVINVEQGTKEWLDWRKTVITATDCPAILGSSPWQTPYKCWQRKLGLIEQQASNAAMERGKRLEPEARNLFINTIGINMVPIVAESSEYSFLGASLDGISDCGKYLLEVKCGGEKLHNMAQHGIIPNYYLEQMQHQMLVTGTNLCYYYSYNGSEGISIKVPRDPDFEDRFMPKARSFWKSVAFFEPPPLAQSDYRDMNDSLEWGEYARMYQEVDANIKAMEEKKDYIRKKLIQLCGEQSCQGEGLKVIKTVVKGRIDYENIPQIKDIDLDKYRKIATSQWKFIQDKIS